MNSFPQSPTLSSDQLVVSLIGYIKLIHQVYGRDVAQSALDGEILTLLKLYFKKNVNDLRKELE